MQYIRMQEADPKESAAFGIAVAVVVGVAFVDFRSKTANKPG